ncbi:hypothetical protein ACA910_001740 [Epithemia clementina (nom. ined.)]
MTDTEEAVVSTEDSSRFQDETMDSECKQSSPKTAMSTKGRRLTRREALNLFFALLAWACTATNSTIAVGSSAVVLLSIGGQSNLTSLPLGSFVFGAAFVSLLVTPWIFVKLGRKNGFLVGVAFGLIGTALGCVCVALQSVPLLIFSMIFFGMAVGVGMFLRFAAIELVPTHWRAKAVALVVSGGVLAAFAGPESAQGMKDAIGGDDLEFMGTFAMSGVFNILNAIFTVLISFPTCSDNDDDDGDEKTRASSDELKTKQLPTLGSLLRTRQFIIPMLVAAIAWAAMAMPMSIVQVVMKDVGYTSRQSLTTIELHFAGMYSPGFITGALISLYGPKRNVVAGIMLFAIALAFNFSATGKGPDDSNARMAVWVLGLFMIGVAWNFCFTAATVLTTELYKKAPPLKPHVQAANDFLMFLLSGAWIVSASYIFEAGGSGLKGWDALNWVVVGLVGLMGVFIILDPVLERFESQFNSQPKGLDEEQCGESLPELEVEKATTRTTSR